MKKLTNKLFLSILSLLLVIATLGSATFAWMSLNSEAWVEGMEFQATGGDGFLISVDDMHYKTMLSKEDIVKSIVKKYSNNTYRFDDKGDLVDENNITITNYMKIMENQIKLYPCTSYGFDQQWLLTTLFGEVVDASAGEFIEFSIYFKPTYAIKQNMDIYLNGEKDKILMQNNQEYAVPETTISTSKVDSIQLSSSLMTYIRDVTNPKYGEMVKMNSNDVLEVRSSNAIRLGFQVNKEESPVILELTDEYDLGSYATNISEYTSSSNPNYDGSILYDAKYDAAKNAMFTYFNGLKNNSLTEIDYKKMPVTITSLLDNDGKNRVKVCTLETSGESVEVTFKLWLEGWDADSIEGIAEAILVQLSFAQ